MRTHMTFDCTRINSCTVKGHMCVLGEEPGNEAIYHNRVHKLWDEFKKLWEEFDIVKLYRGGKWQWVSSASLECILMLEVTYHMFHCGVSVSSWSCNHILNYMQRINITQNVMWPVWLVILVAHLCFFTWWCTCVHYIYYIMHICLLLDT